MANPDPEIFRAIIDGIQVPEPDKRGFKERHFRRPGEFLTSEPIDWLIENVLPRESFSCVFGDSGAGKTFMVIELIMAGIKGEPFMGYAIPRPIKTLYISEEGRRGLPLRCQYAALRHGVDLAAKETEDRFVFRDVIYSPLLDHDGFNGLSGLIEDLEFLRDEEGFEPDLIVFDTFADLIAPGNDSSNEDVGNLNRKLMEVIRMTGAGILYVHHEGKAKEGKAGTYRGASSLKAKMDVMIQVIGQDQDSRTVSCFKSKDSEPFENRMFNLVKLAPDDEFPVIEWLAPGITREINSRMSDKEKGIKFMLNYLQENPRSKSTAGRICEGINGACTEPTITKYLGALLNEGKHPELHGETLPTTDKLGRPNKSAMHYWWDPVPF